MPRYAKSFLFTLFLASISVFSCIKDSVAPPGDDDDDEPPGTSFSTVVGGTSSDEVATDIAIDSGGHIFITGYTSGDLSGISNGGKDIFIAKFESDGDMVWTKQYGSVDDDVANSIILDSSGNIYIAGYTDGTFEAKALSRDIIVAKYDSSGNELWKDQLGSTGTDTAEIIVISATKLYVIGKTDGDLEGEINNGNFDTFVVKYSISSDVPEHTKLLGTAADDIPHGASAQTSGDLYIVGETKGALGTGGLVGSEDAYIAKYLVASDSFDWITQLGTTSKDILMDVAVTGSSVYAAGFSLDDIEGDGGATFGNSDIFLALFNSATGSKTWVKQINSPSIEEAYGLTLDAVGNVYITGKTSGNFDGESGFGSDDIFVTKYDSSGVKQWSEQLGTSSGDIAWAIKEAGENVCIVGETGGNLDGETNQGGKDYFIAQYKSDGTLE